MGGGQGQGQDQGLSREAAIDEPMQVIAARLSGVSGASLGRPIVDQTGLSGTFDYTLEWRAESPPGPETQADTSGPTLLDALKEQLGLKLVPATGRVSTLIIDHIEEPKPN